MQLLQKEVTTFTFFHLGNRIGNVQIITEGKKDFIEITFDQTALERRVGPKLIEKMHHRDFFGSVVTKNTDIDLITQALSIQKVILWISSRSRSSRSFNLLIPQALLYEKQLNAASALVSPFS